MLNTDTDWPKGLISFAVIVLFAYAFIENPQDEIMKGALIAALSSVIGYWLGSSKGSDEKTQMMATAAERPQEVEVVNPDSNPVPTSSQPDTDGELPEEQKL